LSNINTISISPNPSSDYININSINKIKSLALINTIGERVMIYNNLSLNEYQINVSNLSTGVYMLEIGTDGLNEIKKVIISDN